MTAPTRLRLEHLAPGQPCGAERPRGSWLLPAGSAQQQAYALRLLDADVVWESGRRPCSGSVLVDLDAPRVGRSWQVRVWTDQGGSDWSERAPWTVTTLPPLLEEAMWIEPHEPEIAPPGERPAHLLHRTFSLDADVTGATAWATAHGIYELFVNGQRVGDEELTPGFTAYRSRLPVQVHDVGELLRRGRNEVEILLSDGWFRGRHGFERHADGFGTRTAALLVVEAHLADGSTATLATGDGWSSRPSGIRAADLMDGQHTDLRCIGNPHPARPVHRRARLELAVAPPIRRIEELAPVEVRRISPTCTVVDFGQNINGWVRLGDLGPAGTATTLTHGEMPAPDGRVTTENLRAFDFRSGQRLPAGQVDSVVSSGRPGEEFEPRHTTHGFRYVQIDGVPATARAVVVHTDLRETGTFRCSDERIDALHRAAVWSFRGNACGVPTDCPQRERSGFTGDWQVYVDAAAFTHDVAGFSDSWLRDLAADQRPDGRVATVVPEPQDPAGDPATLAMEGSAGWGDAAVFVPWALWRAYGDRALLERQYPSMVRWVRFAADAARTRRHPDRTGARAPHEEFLWDTGFHFGEWLEPGEVPSLDPDRDHGIVATAYLARSAQLLARIATLLGKTDDAMCHHRLACGARDAWQREYLAANGTVAVPTQANHVRALAFDLVPADLRPAVAARLVDLLAATDHHLATGFLTTGLLLPTLSDAGYHDEACRVLTSTGVPSWLGMIDKGATTIWENWAGADDPRGPGSLNHYAKGAVIAFLHTHIAGIRMLEDPGPGEAGYRRFVVAPRPGAGLEWAEAEHDGPYGRIRCAWRLTGGGLHVEVTVPPGSRATVVLPDGRTLEAAPGDHTFSPQA